MPRVEHTDIRLCKFGRIARDDDQAMVLRRGRDNQVRLRKGMTDLAALLEEKSPFEHDVLGYLQDALLEHWPDFVRKPVVEIEPAGGVWQQFDAEPKLSKRYSTDK